MYVCGTKGPTSSLISCGKEQVDHILTPFYSFESLDVLYMYNTTSYCNSLSILAT